MAVAPNGQYLACFTHEGFVTVVNSTFETKVNSVVACLLDF